MIPYWTLEWVYGFNSIFDDPDPTWSSYKYGFLNVLTIASSAAQITVGAIWMFLLVE